MSTPADTRIRRLVAQVAPSPTAATTLVGPSQSSIKALNKLARFTKRAVELPYGAVKNQDLAFDPRALNELVDGVEIETRRRTKRLLAENAAFRDFHGLGLTLPEQRALTQRQVLTFVDSGLYRVDETQEHPLRPMAALETLYYHGCTLATKAGVHFGLFGGTVAALGTASQRAAILPGVQTLDVRGAFCLTELGHGSNARAIETTAHYDPATSEFVLHTPTETAQKIWIGNLAVHATHGVVFAQLFVPAVGADTAAAAAAAASAKPEHHGVHAFLVPLRDIKTGALLPGVRVADCGPKMGLNGVDNGRLWLDRVRVPRDGLLAKLGAVGADHVYRSPIESKERRFTAQISQLVGGRVVVAQGALNHAKIGVTVAVRYALTRRQFGPDNGPEQVLLDLVSHQRLLLPAIARLYALQFAVNHTKGLLDSHVRSVREAATALRAQDATLSEDSAAARAAVEREEHMKELHVLASGLKPLCTRFCARALSDARQACGGMGFHAANRIGPLLSDSDVMRTWEGADEVLLQQVSASLLKEFRQQMARAAGDARGPEAQLRGLLDAFARQMRLEIRDRNPIKYRWVSEQHLRDLAFFEDAFEYREAGLLRSLVNRLHRTKHQYDSAFAVWNHALDLVEPLAEAHVERQVCAHFAAAVLAAPPALRPILSALCSLYALTTIQRHMDWFLTFEYFAPNKSKAVWEEINVLITALRPHARALVDAWDLPDGLVGAPIAGDWVAAFSYPNVPGYEGREKA